MAGGSVAVANNLANLVKNTQLTTIFGAKNFKLIEKHLNETKININIEMDQYKYTPHKGALLPLDTLVLFRGN